MVPLVIILFCKKTKHEKAILLRLHKVLSKVYACDTGCLKTNFFKNINFTKFSVICI